jgi:hypothetical protein
LKVQAACEIELGVAKSSRLCRHGPHLLVPETAKGLLVQFTAYCTTAQGKLEESVVYYYVPYLFTEALQPLGQHATAMITFQGSLHVVLTQYQ